MFTVIFASKSTTFVTIAAARDFLRALPTDSGAYIQYSPEAIAAENGDAPDGQSRDRDGYYIYDVCNDYSLEVCRTPIISRKKYVNIYGYFTDNEGYKIPAIAMLRVPDGEIHYIKTERKIRGNLDATFFNQFERV